VIKSEQLREFAVTGYHLLPGVVPEPLLAAADREIDALIAADPPEAGTAGPHFYFRPPVDLPAADRALRESGALSAAAELVAPLRLDHGFGHIQVALSVPPFDHRPGSPHIDGHRPELQRPDSFTMLAGIVLTDETRPGHGNLWIWPGSHLTHQDYLREHGARAFLPVSGQPGLLAQPPSYSGEPFPLLAARGDLLLAHYLLGHNIGGNTSDRVRRMLYYRLTCTGHEARWAATCTDAFTEYEPVRAAVARPEYRLPCSPRG
jgi:ectoine hydroxylase-related dioxygenase (phytanoyl-CoA dioxygenase family)